MQGVLPGSSREALFIQASVGFSWEGGAPRGLGECLVCWGRVHLLQPPLFSSHGVGQAPWVVLFPLPSCFWSSTLPPLGIVVVAFLWQCLGPCPQVHTARGSCEI